MNNETIMDQYLVLMRGRDVFRWSKNIFIYDEDSHNGELLWTNFGGVGQRILLWVCYAFNIWWNWREIWLLVALYECMFFSFFFFLIYKKWVIISGGFKMGRRWWPFVSVLRPLLSWGSKILSPDEKIPQSAIGDHFWKFEHWSVEPIVNSKFHFTMDKICYEPSCIPLNYLVLKSHLIYLWSFDKKKGHIRPVGIYRYIFWFLVFSTARRVPFLASLPSFWWL